jgi:hypothetical protein
MKLELEDVVVDNIVIGVLKEAINDAAYSIMLETKHGGGEATAIMNIIDGITIISKMNEVIEHFGGYTVDVQQALAEAEVLINEEILKEFDLGGDQYESTLPPLYPDTPYEEARMADADVAYWKDGVPYDRLGVQVPVKTPEKSPQEQELSDFLSRFY